MHRHASLQATAETYAQSVLEIGPDDRCLSVAKLFFAYGLDAPDVPALGRRQRRAQSPASDAGRRAWPCPGRTAHPVLRHPGFVAALLDADAPDGAFASVRATVAAGEALPADLHRRFGARFDPSRARRDRHDRGAAHLPVQHEGRRAGGHQRRPSSATARADRRRDRR